MSRIRISVGDLNFVARLEVAKAPETCRAFFALLPYRQRLVQARWSGEAGWIPLGSFEMGVGPENATSFPSRGDVLFHPAGSSEAEFLFVYGSCRFGSKVGTLAGNHFLTIEEGREGLEEVGRRLMWEGAQDVEFASL